MRRVFIYSAIMLLAACSLEPGSEKWCAMKKDQPKSEWSGDDVVTYAKNCLLEGSAVGSKNWCETLSEKPKGEWTANEAASYAKYCVI